MCIRDRSVAVGNVPVGRTPPEVADQLFKSDQFPVPPTQKKSAALEENIKRDIPIIKVNRLKKVIE